MTDHHTAIGSMTRDAWKRGRMTGLLEGLALGFIAGVGIVFIRFILEST